MTSKLGRELQKVEQFKYSNLNLIWFFGDEISAVIPGARWRDYNFAFYSVVLSDQHVMLEVTSQPKPTITIEELLKKKSSMFHALYDINTVAYEHRVSSENN